MKGKVLLKGLVLLVCMLMLSVSAVLAQDPCEGIDIDGDGSVVLSPEACDLGDRYGQCTLTEEACANDGDCPPGQCSETGGGCTVEADCPTGVCSNGDPCTIDDDCPTWSPTCILSQTCDPVTQTCDDVAWCSAPQNHLRTAEHNALAIVVTMQIVMVYVHFTWNGRVQDNCALSLWWLYSIRIDLYRHITRVKQLVPSVLWMVIVRDRYVRMSITVLMMLTRIKRMQMVMVQVMCVMIALTRTVMAMETLDFLITLVLMITVLMYPMQTRLILMVMVLGMPVIPAKLQYPPWVSGG